LDGTELDAPFRRSLFLRNRFLARITVTTRGHARHDFCRLPNWILDAAELSRPTPQRLEFNRAGLDWRGAWSSRLEPARLRHRPLRLH
jgi:hypothetical protein